MLKNDEFMRRFRSVGENVQIFENSLILKPEMIDIGDGTRIDDFSRIEGGNGIVIGKFVHIASFASILGGGKAVIGNFTALSQGCKLITGIGHSFEAHFEIDLPEGHIYRTRLMGEIIIGSYVAVNVNVAIFPGVTIGDGAMIGANSVVTKDVEPWTLVIGAPAKFVKRLSK